MPAGLQGLLRRSIARLPPCHCTSAPAAVLPHPAGLTLPHRSSLSPSITLQCRLCHALPACLNPEPGLRCRLARHLSLAAPCVPPVTMTPSHPPPLLLLALCLCWCCQLQKDGLHGETWANPRSIPRTLGACHSKPADPLPDPAISLRDKSPPEWQVARQHRFKPHRTRGPVFHALY
jgi:hypothetical protein